MKKNQKYVAPAILEDVDVELGCHILAESMEVTSSETDIESVGQEVETHALEHNWE